MENIVTEAEIMMNIALRSVDQCTDLELGSLKFEGCPVKKNKIWVRKTKEFFLSDEEWGQIAQKSAREMGYSIEKPFVEHVKRPKLPEAVLITDEYRSNPLKLLLCQFYGNWSYGHDRFVDDDKLRLSIAQTMTEKYGEPYKKEFSKYWISFFRHKAEKHGDFISKSQELEKHLENIGMKTDSPHLLILDKTCNYNDLEKI